MVLDGWQQLLLLVAGWVGASLGIVLRFDRRELPCLTEWKMPCQGFYVVGLEPGTVTPMGRGYLRERGELPFLEPQKIHEVHIEFSVLDRAEEIDALVREAETSGRKS